MVKIILGGLLVIVILGGVIFYYQNQKTTPNIPATTDANTSLDQNDYAPTETKKTEVKPITNTGASSNLSNTVVNGTTKNDRGVDVSIVEHAKIYSYSDLQIELNKYSKSDWDIVLLTPPAYPYMYKLTKKQDSGTQVAIWYSGKYLLTFQSVALFADGSPREQVLEDYLKTYPSSVAPE